MEDVTSDDESLFLSVNLTAVLKKSTPGKFAYTCHFQKIGINGNSFSIPVAASSILKLPNFSANEAVIYINTSREGCDILAV